ncbi:hypothetical protein [Pseudomonas eucalypticola]|uniref:Uncharacterized protein n=1 Tax=Pseudomonas eucalypticola TaxID=2599595 RepID=A0A7D5D424_9PSED|nr:hypothetical protein [Pseudomonas eucalypticola]QKZ02400.1 hypothetical protein HWQ56_00765 [Pseudomonas eucalypticola]
MHLHIIRKFAPCLWQVWHFESVLAGAVRFQEGLTGGFPFVMIITSPDSIKKAPLACAVLVGIFSGFYALLVPIFPWFFWPALVVLILYAMYLTYANERFTSFANFVVYLPFISFAFMSCSTAHTLASDDWGWMSWQADLFSLAVAAVISALASWVYFTRSFVPSFKVVARRVKSLPWDGWTPNLPLSLIIIFAIYIVINMAAASKSSLPMTLVSLTTTASLLFYFRHLIRGLRTLRAQEREQGVFYTFENIEEIREARSRWWLVRLYRWASGLRRSPK